MLVIIIFVIIVIMVIIITQKYGSADFSTQNAISIKNEIMDRYDEISSEVQYLGLKKTYY